MGWTVNGEKVFDGEGGAEDLRCATMPLGLLVDPDMENLERHFCLTFSHSFKTLKMSIFFRRASHLREQW